SSGQNSWASQVYDDGLVHLDPTKRRVYVKGDEKRLTPTEFRLLNALVRHAGAVLSPNQLLTQAWDDPTGIGQERDKFAVLRLRRKLGWPGPAEARVGGRGAGAGKVGGPPVARQAGLVGSRRVADRVRPRVRLPLPPSGWRK